MHASAHGTAATCATPSHAQQAHEAQAAAVLTIPAENLDDLKDLVAYCLETFKNEYAGIEEEMEMTIESTIMPAAQVPMEIQDNLVDAIMACHDGVLRYIPSIPDVVETSSNLGIVNIGNGEASMLILARSSNETMMEYLQEMQECCFSMAGMKVEYGGQYGAWQPNFSSPITATMVKVYKETFGEDAKVHKVQHRAGICLSNSFRNTQNFSTEGMLHRSLGV